MISMLAPHPSGAAVTLRLQCPAMSWVLLRRLDNNFSAYPDPDALQIDSGDGQLAVVELLDYTGLKNGETVWYRMFESQDGVSWSPSGASRSVTPSYESQPQFHSLDPVELVRERLEVGLNGELELGSITHSRGAVPVLRAPPLFDQTVFPCVTVLLTIRSTEHRFIGDNLISDWYDATNGEIETYQGWLDRSRIEVAVWSLNADERAEMRHAVERILLLNQPIFDAVFSEMDVSQSDRFDAESYNVPVYQAVFEVSALHPAIVRDTVTPINHIETYPYGERIHAHD